jgi:hypothetical protein
MAVYCTSAVSLETIRLLSVYLYCWCAEIWSSRLLLCIFYKVTVVTVLPDSAVVPCIPSSFNMSQTQINAIVVNITLDGQSYHEWAFCVETVLRGFGLYFHLTDDPSPRVADGSNADAIKTWEIKDK